MKKVLMFIILVLLLFVCASCGSENVTEEKIYSNEELEKEYINILNKTAELYEEYKDSDNQELLDVFKYIGAGVGDNVVNVRIIDIDDKKIEIFKKYISDFDAINFMNTEHGFVEQADSN